VDGVCIVPCLQETGRYPSGIVTTTRQLYCVYTQSGSSLLNLCRFAAKVAA
jgi:hypothetical protein